jgi:hypothetical protein
MPIEQLLDNGDQTGADPRHDANTCDLSSKGLKVVLILPKPGQRELDFNPAFFVFN